MIIRRVVPLSAARLCGALYTLLGLVIGGIFSMIAMAGGLASDEFANRGIAAIVGVGAIIVFPILYGAMGFVATLVGAWLYNLVAGIVGGVEIEVQ